MSLGGLFFHGNRKIVKKDSHKDPKALRAQ
ncbi:MAG: hypothetical protein ACI8VT_004497 [Saprospiraceae bacterium]